MTEESSDPRDIEHHPRRRVSLLGQVRAEQHLLRQYRSGRIHHGLMLCGPRGIGKATLAYRLARFIFQFPDASAGAGQSLHVPGESAVAHRVASGGHPDLVVIERRFDPKTGRIKGEIGVDDARRAGEFFGHTAGAGGWRICIVDLADDLNAELANALLKTLEEPPSRSLLILVSHQPRSLLPTIRSRCVRIDLERLSAQDTLAVLQDIRPDHDDLESAAALSRGSPGGALEIMESAGARAFQTFAQRIERSARLDFESKISIADAFQGRGTAEDFAIFGDLLLTWTGERARATAIAGNGARAAQAHDTIAHSIRLANALNLDRRQTVLEALTVVEEAAKAT